MNTTFNFQRFIKLFCNEWQINLKKLLFLWGGLLGFAVIYFGICASMGDRANLMGTLVIFFMVALAFQGIATSVYWGDLTTKARTQALFSLPASMTEKFTVKNIFLLLIFPLMMLLSLILILRVNLEYNIWAEKVFSLSPQKKTDMDFIAYFLEHNMILLPLAIWFFAAGSYLCGAMTFKKLAPIKTFLSLLLFYVLLIPVTALLYTIISGHSPNAYAPFLFISEIDAEGFSFMDKQTHYYYIASLIIGTYLIIIARIKFNEKTI